jgi:hypothetical protein
MTSEPTVSIIVPLYNQAQSVAKAIESVLAQTFCRWELIMINDGSTDGGADIVARYQDQRIKLFHRSKPSGGPGKPRNEGLTHARGEWVLFLDADDAIDPDHLAVLLNTTKEYPSAEIIAGHWQEYLADTPTQRTLMSPAGYPTGLSELPSLAIAAAPWAVHAAIVKRHILTPPYCWVEELDPHVSEDTAFWFRLLSRYSCAYSANQGALYQRSPDSRNQTLNTARWLAGNQAVTESNVSFLQQTQLPLTAKHCEYLMRLYSSIYCLARKQRDQQTAATAIALAQDWFSKCFALGGCTSLSLKARKVLGIQKFLWIATLPEFFQIFRRFSLSF